MNCCDDMDFEREGRAAFEIRGRNLVIRESGACPHCGAFIDRKTTVDLDIIAQETPADDWDVENIEAADCPACNGAGGGSVRCPSCNPSHGD